MKKRSKLSLMLFIPCVAFLSGCTNTKTPEVKEEISKTTNITETTQ